MKSKIRAYLKFLLYLWSYIRHTRVRSGQCQLFITWTSPVYETVNSNNEKSWKKYRIFFLQVYWLAMAGSINTNSNSEKVIHPWSSCNTSNPFMHDVEKYTLKIWQCSHRKILKYVWPFFCVKGLYRSHDVKCAWSFDRQLHRLHLSHGFFKWLLIFMVQ